MNIIEQQEHKLLCTKVPNYLLEDIQLGFNSKLRSALILERFGNEKRSWHFVHWDRCGEIVR
jgi:hypothetical protein